MRRVTKPGISSPSQQFPTQFSDLPLACPEPLRLRFIASRSWCRVCGAVQEGLPRSSSMLILKGTASGGANGSVGVVVAILQFMTMRENENCNKDSNAEGCSKEDLLTGSAATICWAAHAVMFSNQGKGGLRRRLWRRSRSWSFEKERTKRRARWLV